MRKFAGVLYLAVIASLVLAPFPASAAFESYVKFKGKKQGKAKAVQRDVDRAPTGNTRPNPVLNSNGILDGGTSFSTGGPAPAGTPTRGGASSGAGKLY